VGWLFLRAENSIGYRYRFQPLWLRKNMEDVMKHLTDTNQVIGRNYRIDIKDSNNLLDTFSKIERAAIATAAHEEIALFFKHYHKKIHTMYIFTLRLDSLIDMVEYGDGRLTNTIIEDIREVNLLDI
jgi:hypothetical protein